MPLFVDARIEPCQCCYFTDWQRKIVERLEDIQIQHFSQTCRICGFSEKWLGFYDEEDQ